MIDQDYEELLGRAPPHGDVLEWTFPTSYLANTFASLLVGTPILCLVLYGSGESSGDWDPRGGAELRIPTLTRLGLQGPAGEVLTAGLHLAAVVALPLFWCVRLAHHQRLQARTGVARYDQEADGAMRWITAAWVMGALGAILLFVGASVPGDDRASFSAQGVAHLTLFVSAAAGFVGQATCTAWALRKARRVFVVSDADRVSYRRKMWLASLTAVAALATVASVLLIERFVDDAWADNSSDTGIASSGAFEAPAGASLAASFETVAIEVRGGGGGRDCDAEWCYSRSALGLWEWVLLVLEAAFCVSLRHDLIPATGGVGVESFVL